MAPTRCTTLAGLAVIEAAGRDARSFLQGQLSGDLLEIDRHPGMLAAACSRQGRVLAVMRLAARDASVLLLLPREMAPLVVAHLSRYVMRADVRFEDASGRIAVAGLLEPRAGWQDAPRRAEDGITVLVAGPHRLVVAGDRARIDAALADVVAAGADDWERAAIADGEPAVLPGTSGLWLPQMINLDLAGGISFSKGCYLGQEIVARTQHLGRIKRRMLRYEGTAPIVLQPGQSLYRGDEAVAQVVRACRDRNGSGCLAVVELDARGDLLGVAPGGSEFVPADLPYAIPAPEEVVAG